MGWEGRARGFQDQGFQRSHFFYEADRDTTNTTRFRLKLVAYLKFFLSGQYAEKYGVRRVRAVLTETTSLARMEQLKRVAGGLAESAPLAAMLFWFTSSGLLRESGVFGAVWKCSGDSRQRSLLD